MCSCCRVPSIGFDSKNEVGDASLVIADTGDEDAGGVAGWSIGEATRLIIQGLSNSV